MLNISAAFFARVRLPCIALLLLAACSPQYNWREIQGEAAPFVIAMPARTTTFSRTIDLDGITTSMTMTAAEVGNNTFAVGSAELPDAIQAQRAVAAIKVALVNNIQGRIRHEKVLTMTRSAQAGAGSVAVTEIEAVGADRLAIEGSPRLLYARFVAVDNSVYQLVATGPEPRMTRDLANIFFSSFKFN